jgi:hypothetical protein
MGGVIKDHVVTFSEQKSQYSRLNGGGTPSECVWVATVLAQHALRDGNYSASRQWLEEALDRLSEVPERERGPVI